MLRTVGVLLTTLAAGLPSRIPCGRRRLRQRSTVCLISVIVLLTLNGPGRQLNVFRRQVSMVVLRLERVATTTIGSTGRCRPTRPSSVSLLTFGTWTLESSILGAPSVSVLSILVLPLNAA